MVEQVRTSHRIASNKSVRDRIAMVLMLLLSAMSVYVAADSFFTFGKVAPNNVGVEAWRMFGYLVFAGLFALVGLFPRRMTGIWELILFHKAATALFLVSYIGQDEGASLTKTISTVVLNDVQLVVTTLVAYVLARGWKAWQLPKPSN